MRGSAFFPQPIRNIWYLRTALNKLGVMSEQIKHECGVAFIRLLKSTQYYIDKYQDPLYGLNKLYLLMEKQHNRGQDGAGVASIRFNPDPGEQYIHLKRSVEANPIEDIFQYIHGFFNKAFQHHPEKWHDHDWLKKNVPYFGELLMGHLRYGTYGNGGLRFCHPIIRQNNWMSRNLVMAGNFNMTNNDELFDHLVNIGQHPRAKNDTVTVLEKVGHFLDEENERLYSRYRQQGYSKKAISPLIAENLSLTNVLQEAAEDLDGGYAMSGMTGHGDSFMFRDPNGIRPAYYYKDDEVLVVASERPAIKTAFNLPFEAIQEVKPGHALIAKKDGNVYEEEILKPKQQTSCSFERIYFSRGTDEAIYHERKALGRQLTPDVLESVDYNFRDTVFSYIPNTSETAFIGLLEGLNKYLDQYKHDQIRAYPDMDSDQLKRLLNLHPRHEQLAVKDAKLRTFIADDTQRDDLVAHVYDSTYGIVRPDQDTVVVLDDSIVRGTTLRQSIISILGRLRPQKIVIVSSAPQIRYPDCYGIDMSKIQDFIAFRAAITLLKEYGLDNRIDEVYEACKRAEALPPAAQTNEVKRIYEPLKTEDISRKIAELITPPGVTAEVEVIFQGIGSLHEACPHNQGDWYFTGNFPTPGGTRVINRAYINFYENRNVRAY